MRTVLRQTSRTRLFFAFVQHSVHAGSRNATRMLLSAGSWSVGAADRGRGLAFQRIGRVIRNLAGCPMSPCRRHLGLNPTKMPYLRLSLGLFFYNLLTNAN